MHQDLFPLDYSDAYFNAINFSNQLHNDKTFGCFVLDYKNGDKTLMIGFIIFKLELAHKSKIQTNYFNLFQGQRLCLYISTIGIHPLFGRQGLGKFLVYHLICISLFESLIRVWECRLLLPAHGGLQ